MAQLEHKQKMLLAFIGAKLGAVDPIRIMKGMFIISKEARESWWRIPTRYRFVPYSYGPCSFEIYSDLEKLEKLRLLQSNQPPGQSWKYYSVTQRGKNFLEMIKEGFIPGSLEYTKKVREYVESVSFRTLLAAVYAKYPDYAVNSVFKF